MNKPHNITCAVSPVVAEPARLGVAPVGRRCSSAKCSREDLHMQQAQEYVEGGPEMVCRLRRTLYGLRRAPHIWHMSLKKELGNFEFVASNGGTALFTGVIAGEWVYLGVWVDDILARARAQNWSALAQGPRVLYCYGSTSALVSSLMPHLRVALDCGPIQQQYIRWLSDVTWSAYDEPTDPLAITAKLDTLYTRADEHMPCTKETSVWAPMKRNSQCLGFALSR